MKSIISLPLVEHFQEKQEIAIQNYSVEEFVLEEPSTLPIQTEKSQKHVTFALPPESVQAVAPPPSKSNKKERKSLKRLSVRLCLLKILPESR